MSDTLQTAIRERQLNAPDSPAPSRRAIEVVEAETHNLRRVSCLFPHGALTVVTGVSGSGKSSLAFDTVYAEGQRRYVETLSTYSRQFVEQMRRPPVRAVRNMPPALALKQGSTVSNARSTVGGVTEINDHLRLLFAGAGTTKCKKCGGRVEKHSARSVEEALLERALGERVILLATVRPSEDEDLATLLRQLAADGFRRVWSGGGPVEIDSVEALDALEQGAVRVVVDRIQVERESSRLSEAVEAALSIGDCVLDVLYWEREGGVERFHRAFACVDCAAPHLEPIAAMFDPFSTLGTCPTCSGFGRTTGVDFDKVIPDPRLSLASGAIAPFRTPAMRRHQRALLAACKEAGVDIDTPWIDLEPEHQAAVCGRRIGNALGVRGFFSALEEDRHKPHIRMLVASYRGYTDCPDCDATGLSPDARAVRLGGADIGALGKLAIGDLARWLSDLQLPPTLSSALSPLLDETRARVGYLVDAGVDYLTLDRQARTLSGGEMHRVMLAASVGRMLTDTCYVLDEPTAGLHPQDTARLLAVIERLRDIGNTVIVVEHDPDVIERADHIIELGPDAGLHGGHVTFEGTLEGLRASGTRTGRALSERRALREPAPDASWRDFLVVSGACRHNLRDVSASFPLTALTVVTGVSGSGKSTLVGDVLYGALLERRGGRSPVPLGPAQVQGDSFYEVVLVEQGSLSTSSRSCPLTFSGAYGPIRELFASTPAARARGFTAGVFSFNTAGGRCARCEGTGVRTVEMHFMADVELVCDVCDGQRFTPDVLAVQVRDRSIFDVLEMTVATAMEFFESSRAIVRSLDPMVRVGLGYVKLGQPTSTMSGGELQRLKLASHLGASVPSGPRLFIFDEPTVGLHIDDVELLVGALRELTAGGDTVIVVEHNLDFIAACDWVVDLGPGAGPAGGRVVWEGRVSGLMAADESSTGRHLRAICGTLR